MEKKIEKLHNMGCDTTEALKRMADDEEFYMECLQEVLDHPGFDGLNKALKEKDVEAAFDYAHALKGLLGNVGLTPMYQLAAEIVEPLRAGSCDHLTKKFKALLEMRKQYQKILF
ncbi:MAG: Hpt domain-containing protein [bacterium]|nr:Hpt domain-containing protein [bacterium]